MRTKKYWILVLVLAICGAGLWAVSARAKPDTDEESRRVKKTYRANLHGLSGVDVLVNISGENAEAEKDGLKQHALETDVELRLRQAGIKVFTKEEREKTVGQPIFAVELTLLKDRILKMYCYVLDIHLAERAILVRNTSRTVWGDSWDTREWIGMVDAQNFTRLRDKLRDVTDEFINDYLAANPKEQPGKKDSAEKRK